MPAAIASVALINHDVASLNDLVDRIFDGTTVEGDSETQWMQRTRSLRTPPPAKVLLPHRRSSVVAAWPVSGARPRAACRSRAADSGDSSGLRQRFMDKCFILFM